MTTRKSIAQVLRRGTVGEQDPMADELYEYELANLLLALVRGRCCEMKNLEYVYVVTVRTTGPGASRLDR